MSRTKNNILENWKVAFLIGLLLLGMVLPGVTQGEVRGKISGRVVDAKTGEPLFGANVMVKGTLLGTATDPDGQFLIPNLPVGIFDVEASMMGYKKKQKKDVRILLEQETEITLRLEPTALQQPTLVITATKRKQHIEDASTSVDVVSRADIQARSVTNLDEVLQNTAGFSVIDGQIDLRGSTGFNWAAGSRVLLMVDGHPLINGDTGGINWDAIPVEEVERVEIVKGAGSALYGSNAMAGMVNIITRDPTPYPETRVKLSWGFYDKPAYSEWGLWAEDRFFSDKLFNRARLIPRHMLSFEGIDLSHSRQIGKVGILFTLGRKRSSGYEQNGDFSRWNALGKLKVRFSPQKSLTITGNWALDDHGDFLQWLSKDRPLEVPEEELGNRVRYEKANLHTTFQHGVNGRLAYTLKANVYRCHWKNFFYDNEDYAITDRIGTEAQVDVLWGKQIFTFGSEITTHHANSMIYGNRDTWDFAVYGEDELKFSPALTLILGTRYDIHKIVNLSSDQQISPRMGLVYRPWEGTSFRLSAGHGFRAPSIAEIFADITVSGFHVVPNLDLKKAERAWSVETGVRQALNLNLYTGPYTTSFWGNPFRWTTEHLNPHLIADLTLFWSLYNNMIDVGMSPELSMAEVQFMNLGKARNRGLEVKITGSLLDYHLSANVGYTLIDPKNMDTGKMLNYRSRHRIVTGVELRFWRITLGWDYRYASRIEEVVNLLGSGFDERVPMHVMDGRIILDLGSTQISLEGKNLRNYHYTLRQRFLEPIRHFVVTLRRKF